MSERGEDERAVSGEDLAVALKVLARVAEDRTLLAGVDAETRTMLQKLAGEVARPDLKQRKKLQRAILRRERDARRARDEALRKGTGIQQLREAPVFLTPIPELPPAGHRRVRLVAGAPRPRTPRRHADAAAPRPSRATTARSSPSRASATSARRRTTGSTASTISCAAPCGDENFARRTATVDLARARGARHRCAREDRLPGRDPAACAPAAA